MFPGNFAPRIRIFVLAQTSSPTTEAARRYASALFDLAQEGGDLAGAHADFADITSTINASEDLSRLIASPLFAREDKAQALKQVAEKAGLSGLLVKFLGTMAINGRASDIPMAQTAFDTLYAKHRGVQRAVARTATEMDDAQRTRLEGIITKAVGGDVELTTEVDADLVGGIQLRIGSTLVDASLKAKLERMNTAMKGA